MKFSSGYSEVWYYTLGKGGTHINKLGKIVLFPFGIFTVVVWGTLEMLFGAEERMDIPEERSDG